MARPCLPLALLCFALFVLTTSATQIREGRFSMQEELKDAVFTADVLSEGSVRSKVDCGRMCSHLSCVAFTFTERVSMNSLCRCHSSVMTSSSLKTPSNGSRTYLSDTANNVDQTDVCSSDVYHELNDAWRSSSNNLETWETYYCDKDLAPGWYRFYLNGENAVMPTSCVPINHCETHAPQWVDLGSNSLPGVGQKIVVRACAHWNNNCCEWESTITVRNCGSYYIYKLQPRTNCQLVFCAEPQQ